MESNSLFSRNLESLMRPFFFDLNCSNLSENSNNTPPILVTGAPGRGKNFGSLTKAIKLAQTHNMLTSKDDHA